MDEAMKEMEKKMQDMRHNLSTALDHHWLCKIKKVKLPLCLTN
jgi:hypothetical protein